MKAALGEAEIEYDVRGAGPAVLFLHAFPLGLSMWDAAVEALRRAAELEPIWSLPQWNLAIAHLHRGDLAAAARAQERADEIDAIAAGSGPPRPQ